MGSEIAFDVCITVNKVLHNAKRLRLKLPVPVNKLATVPVNDGCNPQNVIVNKRYNTVL